MNDCADKSWLNNEEKGDDWTDGTLPTRILQAVGVALFLFFWLNLDGIVPILLGH